MSHRDRLKWEAMLEADPGLSAAWDDFRAKLARTMPMRPLHQAEIDDLRAAADRVLAEAGEGKSHH